MPLGTNDPQKHGFLNHRPRSSLFVCSWNIPGKVPPGESRQRPEEASETEYQVLSPTADSQKLGRRPRRGKDLAHGDSNEGPAGLGHPRY